MTTIIRVGKNIYNDVHLSLWLKNGFEIQTAWGKTYLSAFYMMVRCLYRQGNLKYLFKVRQFIKW